MSRATAVSDINVKIAYLTKKGRRRDVIPLLKAHRPLILKDRVRKQRIDIRATGCAVEFNALLSCLKDNEYDNVKCAKELQTLLNCEKQYTETSKQLKEGLTTGETIGGRVHSSTINSQLSKYKNPVSKEARIIQENNLKTDNSTMIKKVPYKNKWNPNPKNDNGLAV